LASNNFNDWTVGLRLGFPLGYRFAHAQLRQTQLQLARAYLVLQDQELKAERFLGLYYRRMSSAYFQIKAARAQREAFATQLRIRYELYSAGANEPGTGNPVTLNLLLEAQRFWAEALATEYQSIVTYNNSIAGWEYAKGTILQHDNVTISEGPIPVAAQKRAVEHLRQRTKALVLHERSAPTGVLTPPLEMSGPINLYPQINANSLPSIWKDAPPLKEANELPPAENANPQQGDQPPSPIEPAPMNQIFPESEMPTGVKLPEAPQAPAPAMVPPAEKNTATPAQPKSYPPTSTFGTIRPADDTDPLMPTGVKLSDPPPAIKTSAAPARSKANRPASTFGTIRPADDSDSIMPTPVNLPAPAPTTNPSFAPATMPDPPLSALPPPPTTAQPMLPLDANRK
jgi:hypothetical protein